METSFSQKEIWMDATPKKVKLGCGGAMTPLVTFFSSALTYSVHLQLLIY
jgi:hypothetical protein